MFTIRINEYNSLEDFTLQYTGVWAPSEGHWLGLDFKYDNRIYRLSTGSMFKDDEKDLMFYLYEFNNDEYMLLGSYKNMGDLLKSKDIENTAFSVIIMDDNTELLGQD